MSRALWCLVVLLMLCSLFVLAIPAQATVPYHPDSPPSIDQAKIRINRNVAAAGDIVIYAPYNIPYDSVPSVLARQSFIFQLIGTDGTTELGAVTPYTYFDSGYNNGVISFYFAPGHTLVWGTAYYIRISENPAEFSAPLYYNYLISTSSYTTFTSQEDNRVEMATYVVDLASDLESYYSGTTLLETSGGRTVLASPAGENYFRGAIYGLQSMTPSLFLVEIVPIDVTTTNWTTAQFDTYETRFTGTWVGTAQTATANQFGVSTAGLMGMVLIMLLSIGAVVLSTLKYEGKNAYGWAAVGLLLLMGALEGWIPTPVFATLFQLMLVYVAYVLFLTKGQYIHFASFVWVGSTVICMVLEGTYIGSHESRTIINEVSVFFTMNVGDILTLPGILLTFFHGIMRIFIWDYSFYSLCYSFCLLCYPIWILCSAFASENTRAYNRTYRVGKRIKITRPKSKDSLALL